MSYTIKRATWGDESSSTDITKTVMGMYDKQNNYISVDASQNLIPFSFTSSSTRVVLTDDEKQEAKKKAVDMCGGNANDQNCITTNAANFEQSKLQEKMMAANSTANVIAGRRMTVVVVGPDGKEQTIQVPEGQKFELGTKPAPSIFSPPPPAPPSKSVFSLSTWWGLLPWWAQLFITFTAVFFYALGVFIPYRTFMLRDEQITAYVLTALSVVVPYSGYITTPATLAYSYAAQ